MDQRSPVVVGHGSVAYNHIFACLNTLLQKRLATGNTLRVLDIGCGNGRLLGFLHRGFSQLRPGANIEWYGFDVEEQGWGDVAEFERPISDLTSAFPEIPWSERLTRISADDAWPYAAGTFDVAISNQVVEHVRDIDRFLGALRHVLKPDGLSVHLFPLKECVLEAHIKVPFSHWIKDIDIQARWIELSNRMGVGRWRRDRAIFPKSDLRSYAKEQADFVHAGTLYRSYRDIYDACRRNQLSVAHWLTRGLVEMKLRKILRRRARQLYGQRPGIIDAIGFPLFRALSSATLMIRPVEFDVGARVRLEQNARAPGLVTNR